MDEPPPYSEPTKSSKVSKATKSSKASKATKATKSNKASKSSKETKATKSSKPKATKPTKPKATKATKATKPDELCKPDIILCTHIILNDDGLPEILTNPIYRNNGKKVKNFDQKKGNYERCMVDPECEITDIKKFKLSQPLDIKG